MHRFITVLAAALLLVGCAAQGDGTATAEPTIGGSPTGAPASPGTTDDAGGTGAAGGSASAECADAFGEIADMNVSSLTELGDMEDVMQPTIERCGSVEEWVAAAQGALGDDVNPNTAAMLLRMHCGDLSLASTPICQEL